MINLEDEMAQSYLVECGTHLAVMEKNLLAIELGGADVEEELVNCVFRAVHSVKGGAAFFDLAKVHELAHQAEHAMALIRSRQMVPTPGRVSILLRATDTLRALIDDPGASNRVDISAIMTALEGLSADGNACAGPVRGNGWRLRALLVEDDITSRLVLQTFLARYGDCHVAVNGREAVEAYRLALKHRRGYDLICMDIMMPEMDGQEAFKQIRRLEGDAGVLPGKAAKVVMTTALDDVENVMAAIKGGCDAYLIKPIDRAKLLAELKSLHLIS
jgi:two-component system chemotaxis response regulator CheY